MIRAILLAVVLFGTSVPTYAAIQTGSPSDNPYVACDNVDSESYDCEFYYRYDDATCSTSSECDNLVIFFAGGGMKCEDIDSTSSNNMANHLDQYVTSSTGYIVTAACVVTRFVDADEMPFNDEAARVDKLVDEITTWAAANGWNGENLLLSGVSHGAAALYMTMAHETLDGGSHWSGDTQTGVCVYDPPVDAVVRDDAYHKDPDGVDDCNGSGVNGTRNRNICTRYGVATAGSVVSCGNASADLDCDELPTPLPASCSEVGDDTMDGVVASDFAINHHKFVSCGENLEACASGSPVNGPTEGPMDDICTTIDNASGKTCSVNSYGYHAHSQCLDVTLQWGQPIDDCKNWFETLTR